MRGNQVTTKREAAKFPVGTKQEAKVVSGDAKWENVTVVASDEESVTIVFPQGSTRFRLTSFDDETDTWVCRLTGGFMFLRSPDAKKR